MKLNKLLLTTSVFILGLSACNNASKKVEPLVVYEAYGTATGFPTEIVNTFKETYGFDCDIPSIGSETAEWEYEVGPDLLYCYNALYLKTEDNGTPGTDALEDAYLATLTEKGITVDDTYYDDYGYMVYDENDTVLLEFYSYNSKFCLYAFAYTEETESFPTDYLNRFLALLEVKERNIPAPQNAEGTKWHYVASSIAFTAWVDDDGTPGTDAIEDSYKLALEKAGWTIDDSDYEYAGYYATKDVLEICFYSWEGYFNIDIYLQDSEAAEL